MIAGIHSMSALTNGHFKVINALKIYVKAVFHYINRMKTS